MLVWKANVSFIRLLFLNKNANARTSHCMLSKPTGLQSAVTLWCLELEQLKWAHGVFVFLAQRFGSILFLTF